MGMRSLWPLVLALVLGWALPSRADSYEWERTRTTLAQLGLTPDEAPDGKRIAFIKVVRDEVFIREDAFLIPLVLPKVNPLWPNWFHGLTREPTIRRELLFDVGAPYDTARIEETMRNLRGMGIFALVRIVAVRTDDPNAVGVVVHTRDLWSLRLESDFNVTTQIDSLLLRLTERNLFGRNQVAGADFTLLPRTYTWRQFYSARRLFGSNIRVAENVAAIFNRETGKAEGSTWYGSTAAPFYSLRQRWAWATELEYDTRVARQVKLGEVQLYQPVEGGPAARRVWRQRYATMSAAGSYRRGETFKQTFTLGWDFRNLDVNPIAETALPDSLRTGFARDVLPRERTENGPYASYEIWIPRWTTFVNLATFGQSENVRVGPYVSASVRAPLRAFASSTNSYVLASTTGFVLAPHGGLFEARATGSLRYEQEKLVDQLFTTLVRGATPVFAGLRVVGRVVLERRRRDTSRALVSLGASNGLRGYTSQYFYGYGASRALANLELRTLPLHLGAIHVGGVVFYDVGTVFRHFDEMRFHHAAGVGIRFLFPQFNRYPFSLDGGSGLPTSTGIVPTFTSGQVVPLTALEEG